MKNTLIKKMWDHLNRPVILSDQTAPEAPYPYIYYNIIGPPKGMAGMGDVRTQASGANAISVLHDQPIATFSFTACSKNRVENGVEILGDDEAMRLSDDAQHYLEHIGYNELSLLGIVIVDISNQGMRSGLVVDEVDNRYGFDCRVRFEDTTDRNDGSVDTVNYKRSEQL